MQYLGGGFGRRSLNGFVHECIHLAREVRPRPVKLIWTREDDLTYGAYRPMSLQRISATVNKSGKITGFSHLIVGDGDNLIAGGVKNQYYDIEHQYAEMRIVPDHIRLKHWRSVAHGPNKFAIESMIDEIARDQGKDPVDMRRELMKKSPRARATLEKAAEISNWKAPSNPGRAKGVAFLERSGTLSTGVCEISVDKTTGKIRVHHFWSAHDAGVVVHPDNVRAQMEGGIIMGMSSVLKERIDIVDGKVQQSNFDDYQILRMEDIPESIVTELISSREPPQGVGESSTPLVACAIANAFLALTGKNLRHLPFTPDKVLGVLNA
jgi:isoquinoline 1-oxidoreductase beta subunit